MLISEYLSQKTPFSSCGMMLLDIDYFKNINDNYGHLFGDEVLTKFAEFLQSFFRSKDVLVRADGDEFVIFLKDISHQNLIKKSMNFVHMVQKIQFSQKGVSITCSVGVCYLPENVAVFTYNQLFENADWALYQAKTTGRNRYVFCDNLKRFEVTPQTTENEEFIDSRYLRNDIVATALDHFGAGFSVMNLIADLPLNVVKLDRIFINKCQNSHRGSHLIKETIHLLKGLGFTVLCQGIETQGQLDFLRQTECDEIQGNLFYKPLPENKFRELS